MKKNLFLAMLSLTLTTTIVHADSNCLIEKLPQTSSSLYDGFLTGNETIDYTRETENGFILKVVKDSTPEIRINISKKGTQLSSEAFGKTGKGSKRNWVWGSLKDEAGNGYHIRCK